MYLSKHGFIHLIVSMLPVADQVNDYVLVEGLPPLCGHLAHVHHCLWVISIHMEDWGRHDLKGGGGFSVHFGGTHTKDLSPETTFTYSLSLSSVYTI